MTRLPSGRAIARPGDSAARGERSDPVEGARATYTGDAAAAGARTRGSVNHARPRTASGWSSAGALEPRRQAFLRRGHRRRATANFLKTVV